MKKLVILLALTMGSLLVGCKRDPMDATLRNGLVDSEAQRDRRVRNITNLQTRMLVDDWDAFWSYERSSGLTPYIVHVGR
ncbi:MAG: hypothetical protein ACYS8X_08265 [Planctomycetota bacterium]|jgi:hypothetical protein